MSQELPEHVQIGDAVLYQALDNEVVLLNMENQQYYGLNDIGSEMWKLLLECSDVSTVANRLEAAYEVDKAELRGDLNRLVGELLERGLLKSC